MFANLTDKEKSRLNEFQDYLAYINTWDSLQFFHCPNQIIGLFCGNQRGKGAMVSYNYVLRILGMHPVAKKNVSYLECPEGHCYSPAQVRTFRNEHKCPKCNADIHMHKRRCRIIRFASESLPGQTEISARGVKGTSEIKNTQYPEFRRWLPSFLVRKDITQRNPALVIKDPYGLDDITVEFVSYGQNIQATAGHQRLSVWIDEEPNEVFFDEQLPRLFAEDGDLIVSFTPVESITFLFDKVFEKAKIYYRTKTVVEDYYKKVEKKIYPQIETTDSTSDIAVFQSATDDNPTFSKEQINKRFEALDDPAVMHMRRYGIFKAISGRIFKCFDYRIHVIDPEKFFKVAS